MKSPEGHHSFNKCFWKLKKALYDLKQAGKEWNEKLNNELLKLNFRRAKSEPCVYIKTDRNNKTICILSVYVDDILIAGTDHEIKIMKDSIKRKFNIKDIGNVEFVIGIKFNKIENGYILHQIRYINDILFKYEINKLTPSKNLIPVENNKLKCIKINETKYRSAIGNLLYLAICTRPDILFAVSRAARKFNNPNLEDWNNFLKIFRYLMYTKNVIEGNKNKNLNRTQKEINNINNEYKENNKDRNYQYIEGTKRKSNNNSFNINKRKKISNNNNTLIEPYNYKDIFKLNDKSEWLKSVKEELDNMERLKVFTVVNTVPSGSNIISSRWVFKYKRDSNGKIIKRKARLIAKGYTQEYGIDYKETFAPTLKQDTIRIITVIAVNMNFKIKQIDINSAYLNAPLNEHIYMKAPEGHQSYEKSFWKLNKALYGLKQAGKEWNNKLNEELIKIGFTRLKSEPCVYKKINNKKEIICILSVYVDDILIAGTLAEINSVKESIKRKFNIKDIEDVEFVIGIKFNKIKDGYILHQSRYVNDILNKFSTDSYIRTTKNHIPKENPQLRTKKFNETKYRSAIGSLLYLGICTRPDILFAVSKAARKSSDPTMEDWMNVMKIFNYIQHTKNYGIKIQKGMNLKVYVDADYAGDLNTRKSTSGFLMMLGNTPTNWYSKLQHCVSTSTAEAEYYSLSECAKHSLWYRNFMNELNINIDYVTIFVDNKATIYNSENQSINPKSKHIDIRYHHIRDLISKKLIVLKYVKSKSNLADGFTKFLNKTLMDNFRNTVLTEF